MKCDLIFTVLPFVLLISCGEQARRQSTEELEDTRTHNMAENFNSYINDGWNKKDFLILKDIAVENYVRNLNGVKVADHQNEVEANMNLFFNGFPDAMVTTDKIVLAGDHLFAQWTFIGTNTGVFGESPPTGKKVNVSGCSTLKFNNEGKMVQEDSYYNELEMLQQLGYTLVPPVFE
tara:strand:- start:1728 stop:2258 length:531 start_codon:yes stop_codon:yes gene_type:complete